MPEQKQEKKAAAVLDQAQPAPAPSAAKQPEQPAVPSGPAPAPAPAPSGQPGPAPAPELPKKEAVSSASALAGSLDEAPVRRGRGRPRKDGDLIAPSQKAERDSAKEERAKRSRVAGETTARMILGVLAAQGGPGLTLDLTKDHEKLAYDSALTSTGELFVYYDWADMPPVMACAFAWSTIGIIFANKPENQGVVSALKAKIGRVLSPKKD